MKPFLLKLDQDVYTRWSSAAKLAGLTLSEWIRRAGNAQLNGGNPRVELSAERYKGPSGKPLKVKAEPGTTLERGSAEREIARRIGHAAGCDCMQCVQAGRFLKSQLSK
jgi:hypothetical protein